MLPIVREVRMVAVEVDGKLEPRPLEIPAVAVVDPRACGRGVMRKLMAVDEKGTILDANEPPEYQFISFKPGPQTVEELTQAERFDSLRHLFGGDYFKLLDAAGPARGMVVYLEGLGGDDYVAPTLEALRADGWTTATKSFKWVSSFERIDAAGEGGIERAGEAVARAMDDCLAEEAYAVEALLEYLEATRPELPRRPLVLIGASGGALAAPAIAARLAGRVDAAVLIAGGANLFEITQFSSRTGGGLEIGWPPGGPTGEMIAAISERYLARSRLDAAHSACFLANVPAVVFDGRFDRIVPARCGDLLYERLARPERIRFFGGHAIVFWRLPGYAEWIRDWVRRATEQGGK